MRGKKLNKILYENAESTEFVVNYDWNTWIKKFLTDSITNYYFYPNKFYTTPFISPATAVAVVVVVVMARALLISREDPWCAEKNAQEKLESE